MDKLLDNPDAPPPPKEKKQTNSSGILSGILDFLSMNLLFIPRFLYVALLKSFSIWAIGAFIISFIAAAVAATTELFDSLLTGQFTGRLSARDYNVSWWVFAGIVVNFTSQAIAVGVKEYMINMMAWFYRRVLTKHLMREYFNGRNYYQILNMGSHSVANPDQNIVKDCDDFCNNRARLEVEFFAYAIKLVVSYTLMFFAGMHPLHYVASLIWPFIFLVAYGVSVPLASQFLAVRKSFEGKYRYFHTRIREYSESMAFYNGENTEKRNVTKVFIGLMINTALHAVAMVPLNFVAFVTEIGPSMSLVLSFTILIFFTNAYDKVTDFSGQLMYEFKLSSIPLFAFISMFQLTDTFSRIVGNTQRVYKVFQSCAKAKRMAKKAGKIHENQDMIRLNGVTSATPNGKILSRDLDLTISKETGSLLIMGPSGCGKSSLLRVIAGLWDPLRGTVERPFNLGRNGFFFLPQKPYLIKGDLRDNIIYPFREKELFSDERYNYAMPTEFEIFQCLKMANISYLIGRTQHLHGKFVDWEKELSAGEMQRIGFARLFYHRPSFAILDESTSALDSENEDLVYENCKKLGITLISVAHRASTKRFHDNILQMTGNSGDWSLRKITEDEKKKPQYNWKEISGHKHEYLPYEEEYTILFKKDIREEIAMGKKKSTDGESKTGINLICCLRCCRLNCVMCLPTFLTSLISSGFKKLDAFDITVGSVLDVLDFFVFIGFIVSLVLGSVLYAFSKIVIGMGFGPMANKNFEGIVQFGIIASVIFVLGGVGNTLRLFFTELLGLSWRRKIVSLMEKKYFRNRVYYKTNKLSEMIPDSDARITQDVDEFTSGFENYGYANILSTIFSNAFMGLLTILLSATYAWFAPVVALIYFTVTFALELVLMSFNAKSQFSQDKKEAFYRYDMARLREFSEQVAFYGGKQREKESIEKKFKMAMKNYFILNFSRFVLHTYSQVTQMLGISGGYLITMVAMQSGIVNTGSMKPSDVSTYIVTLTQMAVSAIIVFNQLITLGPSLSRNIGSVGRIGQALEAFGYLKNQFENNQKNVCVVEEEGKSQGKRGEKSPLMRNSMIGSLNDNENDLVVSSTDLEIVTPDQKRVLLENLNLEIHNQDRILINGPSGCGKSSLLRVLGLLWPIKQGNIRITDSVIFLPQKPYMILGTLKQQIIYPDSASKLTNDELMEIIEKVNLTAVVNRYGNLNVVKEWSTTLSPGEQQRLSFARLFYHRPRIAILDEATAALDEWNEENCYKLCLEQGITLLSVGHRETLNEFHTHLLKYDGEKGWQFFVKGELGGTNNNNNNDNNYQQKKMNNNSQKASSNSEQNQFNFYPNVMVDEEIPRTAYEPPIGGIQYPRNMDE